MLFRLATTDDLPSLNNMYSAIIDDLKKHDIEIWDDIFPICFFPQDIKSKQLYLLFADNVLVGATVVGYEHGGSELHVDWADNTARSAYIKRLGVNVDYRRKGIAAELLNHAKKVAYQNGCEYMRLFVADVNTPAIDMYQKCGFSKIDKIYKDVIAEDFILYEYPFEIKL